MVTYSGGFFILLKTPNDRVRYVKERVNGMPQHLRTREIEKLADELGVCTRTIRRYLHKKIY